jgi:hypothetical protein
MGTINEMDQKSSLSLLDLSGLLCTYSMEFGTLRVKTFESIWIFIKDIDNYTTFSRQKTFILMFPLSFCIFKKYFIPENMISSNLQLNLIGFNFLIWTGNQEKRSDNI